MSNLISIRTHMKHFDSLLRISMYERQRGATDEDVRNTQRSVIEHSYKQAAKLIQILEVPEYDHQYAAGLYASQIIARVADHWVERGSDTLNDDFASYFSELCSMDVYNALPRAWQNAGNLASFQATVIAALDKSLSTYRANPMFHDDEMTMRNFFTEVIIKNSQEILKLVIQFHPDETDEGKQMIYQSAIKSCGRALSDGWLIESENFYNAYNVANETQQNALREMKGNLNAVEAYVARHSEMLWANMNAIYESRPSTLIKANSQSASPT